jgi:hypothetical protein
VQDYEKLGAFYLGRPYDLSKGEPKEGVVLYDSRDLVTHAVIIGMTGSGKTGLGIDVLEEAALDGIPSIAIDPKGDLGNLLLTFPHLAPEDFRPWINADDAARKGMTPDAYAADQAALWKKGLASWNEGPGRIERFRRAVDLAIYTPGSSAGLSLSILKSFSAPPAEILEDRELFSERLSTSVSGLLTLIGIEADPVRSREHILLSTVMGAAWKAGENLDLGTLIARIQNPPVTKIGVLDMESFFPAKDRFGLAMQLNGLLASPSFAAWLEGEPLDIDRLLHGPTGKPRISIISIAHLGDGERTFFVALLLNELLGWMRKQSGTTSLRAILYMDEVAGYVPPVANPPTKPPLLTLLKQARAFGLGVVLATQNPVDLDYKGLSNTGTWFLGRLQTEQDKARVLDGLEGAVSGHGGFDRAQISQMLSSLAKRVFLLHNIHEDAPEVFETRWTLSYLRGPLTREQIRALMAPAVKAASAVSGVQPAAASQGSPASVPSTARPKDGRSTAPPVLPPDIPQYFVPSRRSASPPNYVPRLWASGQIEFNDTKMDVRQTRVIALLAPFSAGPTGVDWDRGEPTDTPFSDLEPEPPSSATYDELPPVAAKAKNYAGWNKDFARWLFETQQLEVFRSPDAELVSKPGETERDFRIRLQVAMREQRDAAKARLQQKYASKIAALQERVRRAQMSVKREQDQASEQKMQSVFSMGATVLGALLGRKTISTANLGRAATAARSVGRAYKQTEDVKVAEQNVEATEGQLADLEAELEAEIDALDGGSDPLTVALEKASVKPKKTQITVGQVALVWVPEEGR